MTCFRCNVCIYQCVSVIPTGDVKPLYQKTVYTRNHCVWTYYTVLIRIVRVIRMIRLIMVVRVVRVVNVKLGELVTCAVYVEVTKGEIDACLCKIR